ncbi:hypothetical protein PENTCL1PPCAC_26860, partial [Pristionchus entomophagus]
SHSPHSSFSSLLILSCFSFQSSRGANRCRATADRITMSEFAVQVLNRSDLSRSQLSTSITALCMQQSESSFALVYLPLISTLGG